MSRYRFSAGAFVTMGKCVTFLAADAGIAMLVGTSRGSLGGETVRTTCNVLSHCHVSTCYYIPFLLCELLC